MNQAERYYPETIQHVIPKKRILGRFSQNQAGPTVVCICSIHGNEPSGTIAFTNVFNQLSQMKNEFYGELVGLAGNMKALKRNVRYINADLNRQWTKENIRLSKKTPQKEKSAEQAELTELCQALSSIFKNAMGPIYVIDLHTTSSKSTPFVSINDTIRNRDFALQFNLPIILGIEEFLEGTILNYINELGFIALGFEGGQHDDLNSIEIHESAIWITIFGSGCMLKADKGKQHHSNLLKKHATYAGKVFELRHRHALNKTDVFSMKPGYTNLQSIKKNEVIAYDQNGVIRSPESGFIFMPLYQKQGNDGFFLVRHVRPFWLFLSKTLRKHNFHYLLYLLPGVTAHNDLRHTIVVNKHIARFGVIDFFHLLGFRRKTKTDKHIIFEKREFDLSGPRAIQANY